MSDARARFKHDAAVAAANDIASGMAIGLGTGSTAILASRRIAERLRTGDLRDVVAYATSIAVADEAAALGIPLLDDDLPRELDVTIDGADEVDPHLDLIKGGGGAFTREKLVAQASRREVIVVDESKLSARLGTRFPLPVEVLAFGWSAQARFCENLGAEVSLRTGADGAPFLTDQGNYVLDCAFGPIDDAPALAERLAARAGIVEHGLFLGLTSELVVAGPDGVRRIRA